MLRPWQARTSDHSCPLHYNHLDSPMVRDGYFYGIGSAVAAVLIAWLAAWPYSVPVILLGAFCLWFFRDPERQIPNLPGAIVSPGDGRVTDVSTVNSGGAKRARISIFLNVLDRKTLLT